MSNKNWIKIMQDTGTFQVNGDDRWWTSNPHLSPLDPPSRFRHHPLTQKQILLEISEET